MAGARGGLTSGAGGQRTLGVEEDALLCSPTPTFVIDEDARVRRANVAGEALLNASEPAMRGRPFDDFARLGEPFARFSARAQDGPFVAYDQQLACAHAPGRRADLALAPLGSRPGWRVVTLHARPAARLSARARRETRRTVDAAAILAHEIKNPLAGIRGAAQLIEGAGEGGDMPRLIRQEVDRVAALLDRMEDLTDTRPLPLVRLNIHAVLQDVVTLARQGFARGRVIEEVYDPSLPEVLGHRDTLAQIFTNLLKNAVEATPGRDGMVRLQTAYRYGVTIGDAGGGRVPLPVEACVVDNGAGVPTTVAADLFTPFVTTKPDGRGLGLPLADKLVGDLGGLLEHARDEPAGLTRFRVLLRRAEEGR